MNSTERELLELDAWIAEHVFGWCRQNFNNGHAAHNCLVEQKFRADKYRRHGFNESFKMIYLEPKYTTDPAAALHVFEKRAEKAGSSEAVYLQWDDGQWKAGVVMSAWFVTADTSELVIAKLAKCSITDNCKLQFAESSSQPILIFQHPRARGKTIKSGHVRSGHTVVGNQSVILEAVHDFNLVEIQAGDGLLE